MEVRERINYSTESSMVISSENKPTFKKVQIVYYLCKNGDLEHPHFIEVTLLAHHPLRLRDVLDRLTVLRGKGMPFLYSWSCKRGYKNGYVWNDLGENDVIYPSQGAEYVLKGSQLVEACTEKVEQIKIGNNNEVEESITFKPKRKVIAAKRHPQPQVYNNDEEDEQQTSYNIPPIVETYPSSFKTRCSRGVSTEDIAPQNETTPSITNPNPQLVIDNSSPLSTDSSTNSEKANESNNNSSNQIVDGHSTGPWPVRGSILRQLIVCGGGPVKPATAVVVRSQPSARKSSSLHKGILCKTAARAVPEEDEDAEMIKFMSENPRFGNVQAEEKEYFSGSIVEGVSEDKVEAEIGPVLQKSSSYNEQRISKTGLGEVNEERDEEVKKGRCLPVKISSSKKSKK